MVELREINHNNWIKCIELEVTDGQRRFVNPNIFSLAEAYVHSDANKADAKAYYRCIPFAIYHGDEMLGFGMRSGIQITRHQNSCIPQADLWLSAQMKMG